MRNFPITRLRGIETYADTLALDRGGLWRAKGAVPYPRDALSSPFVWRDIVELPEEHDPNEALSNWLVYREDAEAPPAPGTYAFSREDFPAFEFAALSNSGALFLSGDETHPQRVWVAESPNKRESVLTGIDSAILSYVDILHAGPLNPSTNPIVVRALSNYQDYILVHHNHGVTVLYDVQAGQDPVTGFRVRQSNTPLVSGAVNQDSCLGRMFIGWDGQLWADMAAAGPPEKFEQRQENVPAYKSTGGYEHLLHEDWRETAFSVWVPTMGAFLPFFRLKESGQTGFFMFNRPALTLTGPVRADGVVKAGNIHGTDIIVAELVDETLVWADLGQLREQEDRAQGEIITLPTEFGADPLADTQITLNWQDFGHGDAHKIVEEVHLNFQHGSRGMAAVEVENESGRISGSRSALQEIKTDRERLKFFRNINGRRFRVHIFIEGTHGKEWTLRSVSVGYNIGNPI